MVNNMTDLTAQEAAWQTRDHLDDPVIGELRNRFGPDAFTVQATRTGVPVVWVKREQLLEVVDFLKKLPKPYVMLFDLHGMDERLRTHRQGLPAADFSVFYHLISIDRNTDIMLKVALSENDMHLPTITKLFPNANWYERETWEMFGMPFDGHPHLTRIMMPKTRLARSHSVGINLWKRASPRRSGSVCQCVRATANSLSSTSASRYSLAGSTSRHAMARFT